MGKKKNFLGRSIIRDHKKQREFVNAGGFRHTSDVQDSVVGPCMNLRSVTEQSSLDDFLEQVKEGENEFPKDMQIMTAGSASGVLSQEERKMIAEFQEEHSYLLSIPRRPHWDATTTKEELDAREREQFLNWRRNLALQKEEKQLNITPYEKNLEIWRQLWRVIEKSHVILQIIDARNPLLFRCEDLERYAKEVDNRKCNVLLLNKADFLSTKQREIWAEYFETIGVKVVFFSALQQMQKNSDEQDTEDDNPLDHSAIADLSEDQKLCKNHHEQMPYRIDAGNQTVTNSSEILSKSELISFLKCLGNASNLQGGVTTIGLVGYPNVGKSSTINAVLTNKKVQVSATPGKTKHFQTIMVDSDLCFCDCPGLVFPKFLATKADMVINGILPIDQLTDHIAPVTLVTELIPRNILESTYSILIPPPQEGKDPSSPPTAEEFLNAYGYMRGFMTQRGIPDTARSARYILKDFINGKLLYCYSPTGTDDKEYQQYSIQTPSSGPKKALSTINRNQSHKTSEEIDRNFFMKKEGQAHVKGVKRFGGYSNSNVLPHSTDSDKPWKKHHNKNKKEKLRRIYSAADQ